MSPRAAWRLEALGYGEVYDYVAGKADWIAAGLPTQGTTASRARVTDIMDPGPATCSPGETVAEVVARLAPSGTRVCVVVNREQAVRGRLRLDRAGAHDARLVEAVMEPGPATVRADADPVEMLDRMRRRGVRSLIVSTPEGSLLGVVHAEQPDQTAP